MKKHLFHTSLKDKSTFYFDFFLQERNKYPFHFFSVDKFSNRVHTPITSLKNEYRKNILLYGEKTVSLDVVQMQPLLLAKILKQEIGDNDFTNWINSGADIYVMLQEKVNLATRAEAKERFYQISYGRANDNLATLFGESNWISWVNELKQKPMMCNPHTLEKEHSNLAWLLQTTEVKLMFKVWYNLINNDIPFLSVHDEIIIRESDYKNARKIFEAVLDSEFEYYKLGDK